MIEKITQLKGIGMLHDSVPSGELALSNAVAIYAENGRGKSTFSHLLRSLTRQRLHGGAGQTGAAPGRRTVC